MLLKRGELLEGTNGESQKDFGQEGTKLDTKIKNGNKCNEGLLLGRVKTISWREVSSLAHVRSYLLSKLVIQGSCSDSVFNVENLIF